MSLNIQTVSNSARQIATKLGISKFDLSGSTVDETSVQVDKGEQKQVKASNRSGITVRVWNNENTGLQFSSPVLNHKVFEAGKFKDCVKSQLTNMKRRT